MSEVGKVEKNKYFCIDCLKFKKIRRVIFKNNVLVVTHKVEVPVSSRNVFQVVDFALAFRSADSATYFSDYWLCRSLKVVLQLRASCVP